MCAYNTQHPGLLTHNLALHDLSTNRATGGQPHAPAPASPAPPRLARILFRCVCVYICVYIYICVCIYIYIYVCNNVYMYILLGRYSLIFSCLLSTVPPLSCITHGTHLTHLTPNMTHLPYLSVPAVLKAGGPDRNRADPPLVKLPQVTYLSIPIYLPTYLP